MQQAILNFPILILPIVVPVIFWAAYHYHKDRHLPEPPLNLLLCFALGIMAAGLSRLMYIGLEPFGLRFDAVALGIDDPLGLLASALLAIGPIEEFAKLLPFLAALIGSLIAAFLHGLYDFLVLLNPYSALPVAAALIVSIWVWRLILMRRMHRDAVRGRNN